MQQDIHPFDFGGLKSRDTFAYGGGRKEASLNEGETAARPRPPRPPSSAAGDRAAPVLLSAAAAEKGAAAVFVARVRECAREASPCAACVCVQGRAALQLWQQCVLRGPSLPLPSHLFG